MIIDSNVFHQKTSNSIIYDNEDNFLHGVVHQSVVTFLNDELEDTAVETPGNAGHRLVALVAVLTLRHPLRPHLDLGLAEGLHHQLRVGAEQGGDLLGLRHVVRLALLLSPFLLEFL